MRLMKYWIIIHVNCVCNSTSLLFFLMCSSLVLWIDNWQELMSKYECLLNLVNWKVHAFTCKYAWCTYTQVLHAHICVHVLIIFDCTAMYTNFCFLGFFFLQFTCIIISIFILKHQQPHIYASNSHFKFRKINYIHFFFFFVLKRGNRQNSSCTLLFLWLFTYYWCNIEETKHLIRNPNFHSISNKLLFFDANSPVIIIIPCDWF